MSLFDNCLSKLRRNQTWLDGNRDWIAVNRATSLPGNYFFALGMDIPGHRAVLRQSMEMEPFSENYLDLSGVILGSPPEGKTEVHSRLGVNILPRPSLQFATDEIITVYFEVYGLEADPEGRRAYLEKVTVSLIKEDKSKLAGFLDVINPWDKKRAASLSLTFNRNPSGSTGAVAEHFTIDPSELVPGNYNLLIEVLDNNSRRTSLTGCFFGLIVK